MLDNISSLRRPQFNYITRYDRHSQGKITTTTRKMKRKKNGQRNCRYYNLTGERCFLSYYFCILNL